MRTIPAIETLILGTFQNHIFCDLIVTFCRGGGPTQLFDFLIYSPYKFRDPPRVVGKTLLCRKFSVSFKNEFMRVEFCHLPFGNISKSPVLAFQLLLIIFSGIAYITIYR